jgi:hypothetical protein
MRIYRPNVPDSIKIGVAYRILRTTEPAEVAALSMKRRLAIARYALGERLGCSEKDLRLDHDPPLAGRPFDVKTRLYTPDANHPEHLFWITAADHRTKTIIRGANGQYSDIVLIKRERRLQRRKTKPKKKFQWAKGRKMQSRPFQTKGTP